MIEENHEKPQSGWSVPGFEHGTSRMRVSCVTTEPSRSVLTGLKLQEYCLNQNIKLIIIIYRRRGVDGRVLAFQPGGSGSIPGGIRNFSFYPGTGLCPLSVFWPVWSLAVALTLCWAHIQGGPPLYMSSFLVHRLLLPLQVSDPRSFVLEVPGRKSNIRGGQITVKETK